MAIPYHSLGMSADVCTHNCLGAELLLRVASSQNTSCWGFIRTARCNRFTGQLADRGFPMSPNASVVTPENGLSQCYPVKSAGIEFIQVEFNGSHHDACAKPSRRRMQVAATESPLHDLDPGIAAGAGERVLNAEAMLAGLQKGNCLACLRAASEGLAAPSRVR